MSWTPKIGPVVKLRLRCAGSALNRTIHHEIKYTRRTLTKFDKRELGGITFRLKQTSKNCASYRFFRDDGVFFPRFSAQPKLPL